MKPMAKIATLPGVRWPWVTTLKGDLAEQVGAGQELRAALDSVRLQLDGLGSQHQVREAVGFSNEQGAPSPLNETA